jgi:hypothetical protein
VIGWLDEILPLIHNGMDRDGEREGHTDGQTIDLLFHESVFYDVFIFLGGHYHIGVMNDDFH